MPGYVFIFSAGAEQTRPPLMRWLKIIQHDVFFFPPTWPVSWRVVKEAEAEHQEDDGSPGDFAQQLQATNSSPLHGSERQHHWSPDDEDKPAKKKERDFIKIGQCLKTMSVFKSDRKCRDLPRHDKIRHSQTWKKHRGGYQQTHRDLTWRPQYRSQFPPFSKDSSVN